MHNVIKMALLSVVSFQTLAHEAPKWFYPNGELVPISVQDEIVKKCQFPQAANKIANAKEGEFEEAFAMLMQARDCILADGIKIEGMPDK
ncbi:hypothetical protein [Vibrio taketomensis]|uniref:hypothetical protein n=1 Tax=Vibrio taketomensis TaxID=2572923 RepID=UPI001389ACD2|nr:hypothetical protein [Vibrio taketomensis]